MRIWFLFFTLVSFSAFSQRHLACDNGLEVLLGATQYGFAVQPGYMRCFSKKLYAKVSPFYSKEVNRDLFHYVMGLDLKGGYTLFNFDNQLFVSAIGGVGFSTEKGRWREADYYDYHQTKWSTIFGAEGEYYLNDHFSIIVNVNQHIVTDFKKAWGFHRWYMMVGLRYHFYRVHKCNPASTHRYKIR